MSIELVDRSGEMDDALKQLAERRLEFALSNYDYRIQNISVVISDLNGPRGGIDKEVRICVRMKGHGEIIVTDRDNDLAACLSRAAARCGRAVARSVDRIQRPKRPAHHGGFDTSLAGPRPIDRGPIDARPTNSGNTNSGNTNAGAMPPMAESPSAMG